MDHSVQKEKQNSRDCPLSQGRGERDTGTSREAEREVHSAAARARFDAAVSVQHGVPTADSFASGEPVDGTATNLVDPEFHPREFPTAAADVIIDVSASSNLTPPPPAPAPAPAPTPVPTSPTSTAFIQGASPPSLVSPPGYHTTTASTLTGVTPETSTTTARVSRSPENSWLEPHPDSGVHFSHLGTLVGSLHYGHVAFDMRPAEIRESVA